MTPLDRSVSVPGRGVSQFTNFGTFTPLRIVCKASVICSGYVCMSGFCLIETEWVEMGRDDTLTEG